MMNVPTEPTKSTQQVSVQYISTQSAQNYKSKRLADRYDSWPFIDNNLQKWFSDAFNFAVAVIYQRRKKENNTAVCLLLDWQCSS